MPHDFVGSALCYAGNHEFLYFQVKDGHPSLVRALQIPLKSGFRKLRLKFSANSRFAVTGRVPSPDIVPPASRLRKTLMYEWIALNGRGAVDVLDEQDFVADLVIEELVDGASGEEETEATGW
jgi:hypothetical protein